MKKQSSYPATHVLQDRRTALSYLWWFLFVVNPIVYTNVTIYCWDGGDLWRGLVIGLFFAFLHAAVLIARDETAEALRARENPSGTRKNSVKDKTYV